MPQADDEWGVALRGAFDRVTDREPSAGSGELSFAQAARAIAPGAPNSVQVPDAPGAVQVPDALVLVQASVAPVVVDVTAAPGSDLALGPERLAEMELVDAPVADVPGSRSRRDRYARRRARRRAAGYLRDPRTILTAASIAVLGISVPVAYASAGQPPAGEAATVQDAAFEPQTLALSAGVEAAGAAGAGFRADSGAYSVTAPGTPLAPAVSQPRVQWPLESRDGAITSTFGPRIAPCASGCSSNHRGIDFGAAQGTPIGSIAAGTIISVSYVDDGGLGVHVVVEHSIDGLRVQSVYGHMVVGSVTVRVGDTVEPGTRLGAVGNTGASTGPHLHLEVIVNGTHVDPLTFLYKYADGRDVSISDRPAVPWNPPMPGGEGEGWTPQQTNTAPPPADVPIAPADTPVPDAGATDPQSSATPDATTPTTPATSDPVESTAPPASPDPEVSTEPSASTDPSAPAPAEPESSGEPTVTDAP